MKSGSSTSSAESEDSDLDLKKQMILAPNNFQHKAGDGTKTRKRYLTDIVPALQGRAGHTQQSYVIDVSGPTTSTNMPTKSTPETSEKKTTIQATLGESIQKKYPTSISFVQDFLANRFRLQARGRVSRTLVERFSSRYAELRKLKDLHCYSSKTFKASLAMTEEELSRSSFNRWMNWGTGSSGKFLTANISGFPRIGNECSLSDILEEEVPDQYFLSEKFIKTILRELKMNRGGRLVLPSQVKAQEEETPEGTML